MAVAATQRIVPYIRRVRLLHRSTGVPGILDHANQYCAAARGHRCTVPSDPVELTKQIKAASDIVAVVGGYLALKPAGPTFKALCPFHTDSRPSLDVDPRRQRYRCWACGKHGDVISFVQEMEKVGFKEARVILANKAGIKLDDKPSPQDQARVRLLGVMKWAQDKYQQCLLNEASAEPARKYLGSRKLSGKSVRDFGLGFAPLDGDWLVQHAYRDRVAEDVLVEVGLTAHRQEGRGQYDRFRDRVMFPIRDVQSRPVGFGGRIMPESPYASRAPKYYNSAETPLFSKSELLYGLDLARHAGAAVGYLAVVEGYTDVMMAHQCGVPQVVATMGTALNARHVNQLQRFAVPKIILVFDADNAGQKAWDKAMQAMISDRDVEIAIANLPSGLDPCDLLSQVGGPEAFQKALADAKPALDFRLDWLLERNSTNTVESTTRIIDDILGVMASAEIVRGQAAGASSRIQVRRELIVTRVSQRLGIRQETVWARLGELQALKRSQAKSEYFEAVADEERGETPTDDSISELPSIGPGPRLEAEKQVLNLLLAYPEFVEKAAPAISPEEIGHTGLRRILAELYSIHAASMTPDMDILRERLHDRPDLFDAAEKRRYVGQHITEPEQNLTRILNWFTKQKSQAEEQSLTSKLKGGSLDHDEAAELLRKLQQRRTG